MKKRFRWELLLFSVLAVFVAVLLAETLVVKVRTTNLKKEPVFYAANVATLRAGTQMEKVGEKQGWYQVRTLKGQVGWVHSSAVQGKKLSLLPTQTKTGATAQEVSLAGKGFNKQVEDKHKAGNPSLNYAAVDMMLTIKVTPAQLKAFLQKGKLGEFGGAK